MMYTNTKDNITAQKRETSVPVGVWCDEAGPPRPSASDCLGDKGEADNTKVYMLPSSECPKEDNPFKRRSRVVRTPPPNKRRDRARSSPGNILEEIIDSVPQEETHIVISDGEEECQKSKRPRMVSPRKEVEQFHVASLDRKKLSLLIQDLCSRLDKCSAIVKANPNTKVELKSEIREAIHVAEKLKSTNERYKKPVPCKCDPPKRTGEKSVKTDLGTYVPIEKEEVEKVSTLKELDTIIWRQWPDGTYVRTSTRQGNPLRNSTDGDLAVVSTAEANEGGLVRMFTEKFPELAAAEEVEAGEDGQTGIATIIQRTSVVGKNGETNTKEKWVYRLRVNKKNEETASLPEVRYQR